MGPTCLFPRALAIGLLVLLPAAVGAQTPTAPAPPQTLGCAPAGAIELPAGIGIDRIKLLDAGKYFDVYTSVEANDERDPGKSVFPAAASHLDLSPSALNRLLADTMLDAHRFRVFDMRANVTAEFSDVQITAKVIDASQVLRPYLEGGRRVSESLVKLSLQAKNLYTGENLLPAGALVTGKTGSVSGDRVVVTGADNPDSPDLQARLSVDFKNALTRAFDAAGERVVSLLRPMARVVSADQCSVDLFGGSRMGLQAKDEAVIFRAQRRKLGETEILVNTRAVALVRCAGVGTDTSQCTVIKAVPGLVPQDGDYAVVTDESIARPRQR